MCNLLINDNNMGINLKKNGRALEYYKKTLKLTDLQRDIIIGTLLGDSSIAKQKTKSYNIKVEQKLENKEYIIHLFFIFKDWCGTEPKIRKIKGGNAKDRESIWFRTYRHNSFTFYYNLFYGGEKKSIPKLLHRYLNERVLAYWFMDDGTKAKSGYILNTQSFTKADNLKLIAALNKNFGFNCSIFCDRDKFKIYINASDKKEFTLLIQPYILDCFVYKLHSI